MKKSLSINALLNGIKVFLNLLFPLITYPLIFRTLGAECYGKFQFSNSVVSYFVLLAALGVSSYAIREGSKYKNDKKKMTQFVSEIFSINLISCCFSLLLLFLSLFFVAKFHDYKLIISILSINVITNTLGVEWLLITYEEFKYITIRTFLFQIISIILLFLFVHSPNDLLIYTAITVLSTGGANILNFLKMKKTLNIHFVFSKALKKHLAPILILFFSTLSQQIYLNSDITLLGLLNSDREVGLYSASAKIFNITKQLINAIIAVSIPRLAYLIGKRKVTKYQPLLYNVFNIVFVLTIPMSLGLCLLSKDIILIIAGIDYIQATVPLTILSFSLIFASLSYLFANAILISFRQEKVVLIASVISSLFNIIFNIILLPKYSIVAAAITTFLSEMIMFSICFHFSRKKVQFLLDVKNLKASVFGCFIIVFICIIIHILIQNLYLRTFLSILLSVVAYFGIHCIFKSPFYLNYIKSKLLYLAKLLS